MFFWGSIIAVFSSIIGQFSRIEIGSGGILFSDIFLPILTFFWVTKKISKKTLWKSIQAFPLFWESFFLISLFSGSLFLAGSEISIHSFLESGFYLFRYFFLLFFSLIVFDELSGNQKKQELFLKAIFISGGILAILGFLQLKFYPDFKEMSKIGWDPHIGRLLSTWFDPNFLGGLFSFLLVLLAGVFSFYFQKYFKKFSSVPFFTFSGISKKNIIIFAIFTGILLLALLLTFSRSALLTFVIPVFFLGILYFRNILIIAILGILFILPFSERAMQRIGDGIQSAVSITQSQPLFLPDATARLRVENFEEGISIVTKNPKNFITGIGFNTIRLHRMKNIHSSGGFDSSLLTVLVTSGILGLVSFLWFYFSLFKKILIRIPYEKNILKKGIQRGLIFSLLGIFAQSFFVNFLFFPLFLLFLFGVIGYTFSHSNQ